MTEPPWARNTYRELEERLSRRHGVRDAIRNDPMAALQYNLLRDMLQHVDEAMADEGVPREIAARITSRIISGCLPNPAEVEHRARLSAEFLDRHRVQPPPPIEVRVTPERFDQLRDGGRG